MKQETIEFELLGIPVYFDIDYFKEKAKRCCTDKEGFIDYFIGVGLGIGIGKDSQKNYDSAVERIRTELLNTLLNDCDSIFSNSTIENGIFKKADDRLFDLIRYGVNRFKDKYRIINFKYDNDNIKVNVFEKKNIFSRLITKKEIKETIYFQKDNIEILFGKYLDGQFMVLTDTETYIFKEGRIYRSKIKKI